MIDGLDLGGLCDNLCYAWIGDEFLHHLKGREVVLKLGKYGCTFGEFLFLLVLWMIFGDVNIMVVICACCTTCFTCFFETSANLHL
ncbi:hypothetical protein LguiA_031207 [Lonicera macranthoides]